MRGLFGKILAGLTIAAFAAMPAARAGQQADNNRPQELQASVEPAKRRVIPEGYYPATHVRLPERIRPERMQRAGNEPVSAPWFSNFAEGGNDIFASGLVIEEKTLTGSWYDHFAEGGNDIFGESPEAKRVEREAVTDAEGYLIFSERKMVGSTSAFASMPLPGMMDGDLMEGGEDARLPKAFSFESDDSPLIIAEMTSPGSDGTLVAERRSSRFRLFSGRRPAEITERDPYNYVPDSRPDTDMPAMVPPAGGRVRRAEVKLPTSSQGLGMASGYFPGR